MYSMVLDDLFAYNGSQYKSLHNEASQHKTQSKYTENQFKKPFW